MHHAIPLSITGSAALVFIILIPSILFFGRLVPDCLDFKIPRGFTLLATVGFFDCLPPRGLELFVRGVFEDCCKEGGVAPPSIPYSGGSPAYLRLERFFS